MQYIPDGTEIVLWGLGEVGKRILAGEFGNYKISFAVDRKWTQRRIELEELGDTGNIAVYSPDTLDEISLGNKVLVLSTYQWEEMAGELEEKGKHIFRDYLPYPYLKSEDLLNIGFLRFCKNDSERTALLKKFSDGKKLCALYGGCHAELYRSWLLKSEQFTEQYRILDLPYVSRAERRNVELLSMPCMYSALDLLLLNFVYPSRECGNPDWRTIKSWAGKSCRVILITNAAFEGYFPQHAKGIKELWKQVARGDKNMNKMIREGKSADEIFSIVSSAGFYSAETANRYYENALKRLELSESACDIQIADYVREYGRKRRLMQDCVHPHPRLMKELTIRVFRKIGLDIDLLTATPDDDFAPGFLRAVSPIYPSVYHALGITEGVENEKICAGHDPDTVVDFWGYVDLYVKCNRPYLCGESQPEVSPLQTDKTELPGAGS